MKHLAPIIRTVLVVGISLSACKKDKLTASSSVEVSASSKKKLQQKYAPMLGVKENEVENIKLYKFIDEWYGTPYKYAGRNKQGVDCSDFTSILMKEVFGEIVSPPSYSMYTNSERKKKSELEEGDLVFFKTSGKEVNHVGVYLINNRFVHASVKAGVIISSLEEEYYKKCFVAGGKPMKVSKVVKD